MVKRFGLVKSLNERLSRESFSIESVVSTNTEESEEPPSKVTLENERLSERVMYLTEQLVDCRSCLLKTQKELESLHSIKEKQFKALVSQLLVFESGLRRKQRELSLAISQRDRLIREQGHIIRFLAGKSGLECGGSIVELRNEALAKIPVLQEEEGEEEKDREVSVRIVEEEGDPQRRRDSMTGGGGDIHLPKKLSCIIETGSEHDSDSAIILDDSSGSPSSSKRISRSVSDVVTKEEDEEDISDEREEPHLLLEGSLDSLLHTKAQLSQKKVTKPRDLKNKSQHSKRGGPLDEEGVDEETVTHEERLLLLHPFHHHHHPINNNKNTTPSSPQTTTISRDTHTGSVICSIFSSDTNEHHTNHRPSSCA